MNTLYWGRGLRLSVTCYQCRIIGKIFCIIRNGRLSLTAIQMFQVSGKLLQNKSIFLTALNG